jgi:hypothetical protein
VTGFACRSLDSAGFVCQARTSGPGKISCKPPGWKRVGVLRATRADIRAARGRTAPRGSKTGGDIQGERGVTDGEKSGGCAWGRTRDPLIKSQLLYQLSYAPTGRLCYPMPRRRATGRVHERKWGGRRDLNPRQPEPQSGALPTELRPPRPASSVRLPTASTVESADESREPKDEKVRKIGPGVQRPSARQKPRNSSGEAVSPRISSGRPAACAAGS